MKAKFFSQPLLVGLDIKPDGLRLVQLSPSKHRFRVERALRLQFTQPVFADGKITFWNCLTEYLIELVRITKLNGCEVVVSVATNLVKMQQLQVPKGMTEKDIMSEIVFHMQQELPGLTDALSIDFNIIQESKEYCDVFFTVARRDYIDAYVNCIEKAGLKVKIVDVDIYALRRVITYTLAETNKLEASAILHITDDLATLIFFNGAAIFQQHWDITKTADLPTQIKSAIQLYSTQMQNQKINQVWVCCADEYKKIFEIVDYLKIFYLDVSARLEVNPTTTERMFAYNSADFIVACGLAMRA